MTSLSPRLAIENERFPLDCFLYHESLGFVAVAMQKSGCSAIKRWYVAIAQPDCYRPDLAFHKHCYSHLALCSRPPEVAAQILASAPRITFVRCPLERLRSAYMDKFVGVPPMEIFEPARELLEDWTRLQGVRVEHDIVHTLNLGGEIVTVPASSAVDYERGLSFREFIDYVALSPDDHLDPHWRPQAAYLRVHPVHTVVPLEQMGIVLDTIAAARGRSDYQTEQTNITRKELSHLDELADMPSSELRRLNLRPRTEELVDPDVRDRVNDRYAEDVDLYEGARRSFGIRQLKPFLDSIATLGNVAIASALLAFGTWTSSQNVLVDGAMFL